MGVRDFAADFPYLTGGAEPLRHHPSSRIFVKMIKEQRLTETISSGGDFLLERSVPRENERRPFQVHRQYLEEQMRVWFTRLVVDPMADVARLKEEISRMVNDGFVGKYVFHFPHRHLPYAGTQMIVIADVAARSDGDLGNPHFVLALQVRQMTAADGCFIQNFGCDPTRIHPELFGCLYVQQETRDRE